MGLQWTVVAVFLYIEIAFLSLLLLPWIRPNLWNKFFRSRLVRTIEARAQLYTYAGAGILLLLFFDAIREVHKYTQTSDMPVELTMLAAGADTIVHMHLFRAQRNLYVSGFALFLWLVIRRVVQLISREAQLMAATETKINDALQKKPDAKKVN